MIIISVESQPQNPEFRNNPESFHQCIIRRIKTTLEFKCKKSLYFLAFSFF